MANSISEFEESTEEAIATIHGQIIETAEAFHSGDRVAQDDFRKSLLAMVFKALMAEPGDVPKYDLDLLPSWVRGAGRKYV